MNLIQSAISLPFLLYFLSVTLIQSVTSGPLGPYVKVCSSRELKQVTELICSTVVRRSKLPRLHQNLEVTNTGDTLDGQGSKEQVTFAKRNTKPVMSEASERVRSKF